MPRTFIFANGTMESWPHGISPQPEPDDLIIAADGGFSHCRRWNWPPHVVVGDMDSIDPLILSELDPTVTEIIRHPAHKDETDLELALKLAISRNSRDIAILGALGGRWDMTFSNLLLLFANFVEGVEVRIYDGKDEVVGMSGRAETHLSGNPGDTLSLLPLSDEVSGITLEGFFYPLSDARLLMGTSQGISNVFNEKTARIRIGTGRLLIMITRKQK
ncbi:thiamine diphosphokinase [Desulfosarcina sp. OttesenSCG-928-G17]|nr:thiamine diphosphokinase [Desulfosarcina sp. OttesenSCG-928-G17]